MKHALSSWHRSTVVRFDLAHVSEAIRADYSDRHFRPTQMEITWHESSFVESRLVKSITVMLSGPALKKDGTDSLNTAQRTYRHHWRETWDAMPSWARDIVDHAESEGGWW